MENRSSPPSRLVLLLVLSFLYSSTSSGSPPAGAPSCDHTSRWGDLPIVFEPNQGQMEPTILFSARVAGGMVLLEQGRVEFLLPSSGTSAAMSAVTCPSKNKASLAGSAERIRLEFAGADRGLKPEGEEELPGRSNFFFGSDSSCWKTGVPQYARVRYREVWPNTDVVFYGRGRRLEYDLVVHPGGDPKEIRFRFQGDGLPWLSEEGDLIFTRGGGTLRELKPIVFQGSAQVAGSFAPDSSGLVHFAVGQFDQTRDLVIDPALAFSTYLGGNDTDYGFGIAVDAAGASYITGWTLSTNFPTSNALQPSSAGGYEAFVSKIDPAGDAFVYSTYLGGSANDSAYAIAVDSAGNAYLAGSTNSTDFPTANALQNADAGGYDVFLTKISPAGDSLVYSTYLGGSSDDQANAVAVDSSGAVYLAGGTVSIDFPTVNPFQATNKGNGDGFVSKVDPSGSSLLYSTFLGGSDGDGIAGIALGPSGVATVVGGTQSADFPLANPIQAVYAGTGDAFVTCLSTQGNALLFSTFLGGSWLDQGNAVAVDSVGDIYATGEAWSTDFPTANAFQPNLNGQEPDAFVSKIDPQAGTLVYSTYLGGTAGDYGFGIAVDSSGNATVVGQGSQDFPVVFPGSWGTGGFVTKFDPDGVPVYSTQFAGVGLGVAVDTAGNAYVTGNTSASDFPTVNAIQPALGGGFYGDAFVTKFVPSADIGVAETVDIAQPPLGGNVTITSNATNLGSDAAVSLVVSIPLPPGLTFVSATPSQGTYDPASGSWTVGSISVAASASLQIQATLAQQGFFTVTAIRVSSSPVDPNPTNDSASVSVCYPPSGPGPAITGPSACVPVGGAGLLASVPDVAGSTFQWSLNGGAIDSGQGTHQITFDSGPAGTVMTLTVVESDPNACPSNPSSLSIPVDFIDVNPPFEPFVCSITRDGITVGCGNGRFCSDSFDVKAQMSVFILRAAHGSAYLPPAASGIFFDLPASDPFAPWAEESYNEGLMEACSTSPLMFCPLDAVTRSSMSKTLLVGEHGTGYLPPACAGIFGDVACPGPLTDWIEQLYAEGITAGCSTNPLMYCPDSPVLREQMAVFLTVTFALP